MSDKNIRKIVREILQEVGTANAELVRNPLSLNNRILFPVGEPKKLLIISPGIDNASGPGFSWTLAAPEHVKYALEARLCSKS